MADWKSICNDIFEIRYFSLCWEKGYPNFLKFLMLLLEKYVYFFIRIFLQCFNVSSEINFNTIENIAFSIKKLFNYSKMKFLRYNISELFSGMQFCKFTF